MLLLSCTLNNKVYVLKESHANNHCFQVVSTMQALGIPTTAEVFTANKSLQLTQTSRRLLWVHTGVIVMVKSMPPTSSWVLVWSSELKRYTPRQ